MNIEEAIEILKDNIKSLEEHTSFKHTNYKKVQAIETLLTAYEKEKGENVKLRLQDIPLIEGELKAYKDRVNELKQELEKENEAIKDCDNIFICLDDAMSEDSANYYRKSYKILKNLIKKQSKEIEELKNITKSYDSFLGTEKIVIADKKFFVNGYFQKNFVSKDKIKAKIEELDKVLNGDIYVIDGHYDDRYYRYLQDKHILQSLLEKE